MAKNPTELSATYEAVRPTYSAFTARLHSLVTMLIEADQTRVHLIESRTKSVDSFVDKATRQGKRYKDPLAEITDIAGIRIITYYTEDAEVLSKLVDHEFVVDELNSQNKVDDLAPNQFGYLSIHKTISLNSARSDLAEWAGYEGLKAEIQIRTVLQHAWAAISHALEYKREAEIPSQFRRKLTRLSGLLELADEEFSGIRKSLADVATEIDDQIRKADYNIELNSISMSEYIENNDLINNALRALVEDTTLVIKDYEDEDFSSHLLEIANAVGLSTVSEVDLALRAAIERAQDFFMAFAKSQDLLNYGDLGHWAAVLLAGYSHTKLWPIANRPNIWADAYMSDAVSSGRSVFRG